MHNQEKAGLKSIQALRALACIIVVLSHYQTSIHYQNGSDLLRLHFFDWGASGVDLFFVISGFIMAYTTKSKENGIATAISFLVKRAKRILPAYYFWLLFSFAIGGAMSIFHYPEKLDSLLSAISFQPNIANTPPNYIADDGFYIARWTLNYEMYFYVIFALSLIFSNHIKLIISWGILSALIIPLLLTGHASFSTTGYDFTSVRQMFYTNPIILEFLMGVIVCKIYDKLTFITPKASLYLLAVATIFLTYALFHDLVRPFSLLAGGIFSLILMFAIKSEVIIFNKTPRVILALGDMSYSLYLSHLPVAAFFKKRFPSMFDNLASQLLMLSIMLITTIILSRLSYKYIEQKMFK
ncbi:acyltransferase [Salmonella enterica]|nr:acyltransferase [Salmonella enterica]